jgi:magnesium transporter
VVARWDSAATELATSGVGFMLHGLLDHLVDGHLEAVRSLDDQVDELEDRLFAERIDNTAVRRHSLALRKSLVALRQVLLPTREVVTTLMRRDHQLVDQPLMPYFQGVYDHVLRASDWTDSLRELVATIREAQLTLQSNRLNMIMKNVTAWTAIIAVPTAITGFYGQNLPYPGSEQPRGFSTPAILLVVFSVGLYVLFKRRDWL